MLIVAPPQSSHRNSAKVTTKNVWRPRCILESHSFAGLIHFFTIRWPKNAPISVVSAHKIPKISKQSTINNFYVPRFFFLWQDSKPKFPIGQCTQKFALLIIFHISSTNTKLKCNFCSSGYQCDDNFWAQKNKPTDLGHPNSGARASVVVYNYY